MKIINIIFRNWLAKIVCVLLAIIFWVYVGIGQTKTANFPGGIPLQINNVPQGLVAITDSSRITVKVVADTEIWKKLSADSFNAYVDLTGLSEGTHEVKVNVSVNVVNVQVVETDPSKILISLEPRIEKEVPVSVLISGKAGAGLVPGEWKADPSKVNVSGARSVINSLLEATAKVQLEGQTSDFKKITKLVGLDSQGKEINNLIFTPQEVIASISIVKAANVKTVGIKVVTTGSPADGYWITKMETDPATVTIAASEQMITSIQYIETESINIQNISKSKTVEIALKPAGGVSILDNISKIKVNISVAKSQASKEIEAGFKWQGLAGSLKVSSVEPTTVKVVAAGAQDALANLSPGDISVIVDLSGYSTAGTYSIDISRSNIAGPAGISVASIVPSAINVRLDTN